MTVPEILRRQQDSRRYQEEGYSVEAFCETYRLGPQECWEEGIRWEARRILREADERMERDENTRRRFGEMIRRQARQILKGQEEHDELMERTRARVKRELERLRREDEFAADAARMGPPEPPEGPPEPPRIEGPPEPPEGPPEPPEGPPLPAPAASAASRAGMPSGLLAVAGLLIVAAAQPRSRARARARARELIPDVPPTPQPIPIPEPIPTPVPQPVPQPVPRAPPPAAAQPLTPTTSSGACSPCKTPQQQRREDKKKRDEKRKKCKQFLSVRVPAHKRKMCVADLAKYLFRKAQRTAKAAVRKKIIAELERQGVPATDLIKLTKRPRRPKAEVEVGGVEIDFEDLLGR